MGALHANIRTCPLTQVAHSKQLRTPYTFRLRDDEHGTRDAFDIPPQEF